TLFRSSPAPISHSTIKLPLGFTDDINVAAPIYIDPMGHIVILSTKLARPGGYPLEVATALPAPYINDHISATLMTRNVLFDHSHQVQVDVYRPLLVSREPLKLPDETTRQFSPITSTCTFQKRKRASQR